MSRKKFVERIRNEYNLVTKKKWHGGTTRDVYVRPFNPDTEPLLGQEENSTQEGE